MKKVSSRRWSSVKCHIQVKRDKERKEPGDTYECGFSAQSAKCDSEIVSGKRSKKMETGAWLTCCRGLAVCGRREI